MKYDRIVSYITEWPWAITEGKLEAIKDLIALRVNGFTLTPQEIEARIGEKRNGSGSTIAGDGAVAVVPVFGMLAHRMNLFTDFSGGTSTERLAEDIRELTEDESIETIVLDIDSEGGIIEGIPELWSVIFQARQKKRIIASANALAASAAYWLATAAHEIVVTPSGSVGSIGVLNIHMEESKAIEDSGVTVTVTKAGKYKGEGNPFEPLTDDAKGYIQNRVDEAYSMFVRDVAKGRGVSVGEVRKGFGEGRLVSAKDAVEAKMADKIGTLHQTLARLTRRKGRKSMVSVALQGERICMLGASGEIVMSAPRELASQLEWAGIQEILVAGVVPRSPTNEWAPEDEAWSAPTLKDFTDQPWEELSDGEKRRIAGHFLWSPAMPPERFSDLKGPHHRASDGKVVWNGLSNLVARFNQLDIPSEDKPAAKRQLRGHYRDGGKDIPDVLQGEEIKEETVSQASSEMRKRRLRAAGLRKLA